MSGVKRKVRKNNSTAQERYKVFMERFPHDATYAGQVAPGDLTKAERADITKGVLGYCEGHRILYKKRALHSCLAPLIFKDGLGRICKEWGHPRSTPSFN